jgi:hypothetical protein
MTFRVHGSPTLDCVISNKAVLNASSKGEPLITSYGAWENGYSFDRFLGTTYAYLGEIAKLDGIQQLVHHYYLKNGLLGAKITAHRIKQFLGNDSNDEVTK